MSAATLSVMSLWTAATLYAIAMVAYAVRLARVADDRHSAKFGAPALVGAGAGARAGDGGRAVRQAERSSGSDTTAPPRRGAKALGIGRTAMTVGAMLHGVGVVSRGVEAGHAPWSNMYEYTISGVLAGVIVFLVIQRRRDVAFAAPLVAAGAVIGVVTALHVFYREALGLMVALDSYWLVIHVPIAVIASGIFGVSGAVSLTQTVKARAAARAAATDQQGEGSNASAAGRGAGTGWWGRLVAIVPPAPALDSIAFRLNAVGFVLWTFTVVTGAMWAEDAWGRFWGWDPKEVWSFVIWVLYAAYLHARTTQGWMGRRAAWLAVAGFVAIILNFTVVNLLLQGKHAYSGL